MKRKVSVSKKIGIGVLIAVIVIFTIGLFISQFIFGISPLALARIVFGKKTHQINPVVNIALLGIGGENHDGGNLTDTIIVAHLDTREKTVSLVSIPRDLWVADIEERINFAYTLYENKVPGSGLTAVERVIEPIIGEPVDFGILIDFGQFIKIIDAIGGIDVDILETFTDERFPISGKENDLCGGDPQFNCRYEKITFTQGKELMNGERALKYVRSRHAQGDAGTDFSRSQRQQQVLIALKNKLLTQEILLNPTKLSEINDIIKNSIKTDLSNEQGALIARQFLGSDLDIRSTMLTQDMPEKNKPGLLVNPPQEQFGNRWVLIPKAKDYRVINEYVKCYFEKKNDCSSLLSK